VSRDIFKTVFEMDAFGRSWLIFGANAGRHSCEGRIGRGVNPPPQFGHTLSSFSAAQAAQKVHS
jgi:hypothetical protein